MEVYSCQVSHFGQSKTVNPKKLAFFQLTNCSTPDLNNEIIALHMNSLCAPPTLLSGSVEASYRLHVNSTIKVQIVKVLVKFLQNDLQLVFSKEKI